MTDKERLERIKKHFPDEAEAQDILAYDKAVEAGLPTQYDLPPDKLKVAQKFAHTGTRTPMVLNHPKKEFKRNATQDSIIEELKRFLSSGESEFDITNVANGDKGYTIVFTIGEDNFKLTVNKTRAKKS